MLLRRTAAFKPFGLVEMAVRNNCPWHRTNWTEFYFPFNAKHNLDKSTENLIKTEGGRRAIMRRVLQEQHFLAWNHQCKPKQKKLSNPL